MTASYATLRNYLRPDDWLPPYRPLVPPTGRPIVSSFTANRAARQNGRVSVFPIVDHSDCQNKQVFDVAGRRQHQPCNRQDRRRN